MPSTPVPLYLQTPWFQGGPSPESLWSPLGPTHHLLSAARSHLATMWPHRHGSGSSSGDRNDRQHRGVPGYKGVPHKVHIGPRHQPAPIPRPQSQLKSRPAAKFFTIPEIPLPSLPKSLPTTGPPFSPPGVPMEVSRVHQALKQVALRYLGSRPPPKKVKCSDQEIDRISWGIDVYRYVYRKGWKRVWMGEEGYRTGPGVGSKTWGKGQNMRQALTSRRGFLPPASCPFSCNKSYTQHGALSPQSPTFPITPGTPH